MRAIINYIYGEFRGAKFNKHLLKNYSIFTWAFGAAFFAKPAKNQANG